MEVNGTLIIFIASFLVFVRLLNIVLWKPVTEIKKERKEEIEQAVDLASQKEFESKELVTALNNQIGSFKLKQKTDFESIISDTKKRLYEEEHNLKTQISKQVKENYTKLKSSKEDCLQKVDYIQLKEAMIKKLIGAVN